MEYIQNTHFDPLPKTSSQSIVEKQYTALSNKDPYLCGQITIPNWIPNSALRANQTYLHLPVIAKQKS